MLTILVEELGRETALSTAVNESSRLIEVWAIINCHWIGAVLPNEVLL